MLDAADVIVIGGGVFGTAAALHLVTEGVGKVVLLERDGVAEGTSAAGAGFIDPWAAGSNPHLGPEELAVEDYGLGFYAQIANEHPEVAHLQNGCLWVAIDEEQWERLTPILDYPSVRTEVLEPEEIGAVTELVRTEAVRRGVFHPDSGQVSAPGAARSMAREFERRGGRLEERRPVLGLAVERGRIAGVETNRGPIRSDRVIMAQGAWSNQLLAAHGVFLPMVPLVVSRIVTEPLGVPGATPPFFVPGVTEGEDEVGYLYVRGEQGRLLWGAHYSAAPRLMFVDRPVAGRFDQLPLDGIQELQRAGKRAAAVVPLLARYRSITVAHGVPCYTPDNRSLVGAVPDLEGLFVLAGCNEMGVTHAPGFGRVLAELIVHGAPRLTSCEPWRPERFDGIVATGGDVLERLGG
jgi:glycine/D-amino acid oxidase-like deaminating enzyme